MKVAVLALFVVACSCQEVIEVSGNRVDKTTGTHLPVRTVSGISGISGVSSYTPAVSGFNNYGLDVNYLSDLRQRVLGSSVNIAPSPLSYVPFQQSQSLLAIRQPSVAVARPAAISIAQPAIHVAQPAIHYAQPAIHYAQPAIHIAQPAVAVARPQVLAVQQQVQQQVHPVNAAIQQVARTVEYRPIPYQDQPIVPQEVVVEPSDQPINIHFKSRSSTVRISQEHIPGEPGSVEQTQSQDEPSKVIHEVTKPVVQEVREVIQPYRQVTQEVQPVVENVHTVVTHGEGQRQQYLAEPIQRQQIIAVRPAVQQYAVPAIQQVQQVRPIAVAVQQPAVQQIQYAVPQVQTLAVPQYRLATQPIVSQYVAQPIVQSVGVRAVAQPVSFGIRAVAQPVVGVNRVVAAQDNAVLRSEELREVRPAVREQRSDYVKFAESS